MRGKFTSWVAPATLHLPQRVGHRRQLALHLPAVRVERPLQAGPFTLWVTLAGILEAGATLDLRFQASGYTLYLRQPPRYGNRVLRMAERGGISFDPKPYA